MPTGTGSSTIVDTTSASGAGYWYDVAEMSARERSRVLLEALRSYRTAEQAMRRRTRASMNMGENDLLALRYLLRAKTQQRDVTPGDLRSYLGVTVPAITVLVNRLIGSGHLERHPNPTDGRSFHLTTTEAADAEVRATLGEMHHRMYDAVVDMPAEDAQTVIDFLARMTRAVDTIDAPATPGAR